MSNRIAPEINEEDAFHFIVRVLRENLMPDMGSSYGYEVYLPNIIRYYLTSVSGLNRGEVDVHYRTVSPAFLTAAWELSRRGILRPGVKALGQQSTDEGSAGAGFSVTLAGRKWLREAGQYDFVPIEPGRFSKLLDTFTPRFGTGFQERSQEAIRCYGANVYMACPKVTESAADVDSRLLWTCHNLRWWTGNSAHHGASARRASSPSSSAELPATIRFPPQSLS